jgi:pimeloyl-ACP methyl ester carboxylesterase
MTSLIAKKNIRLTGAASRPFLLDYYYLANKQPKPVIIFVHGFKGFKDWGIWDLIAQEFAMQNFIFLKFNFSHNGTTTSNPLAFDDLQAFGDNNYSRELADIDSVFQWLDSADADISSAEKNLQQLGLIGHSRGGAISIIHAAENKRIAALSTWAAVSKLDYAWQQAGHIEDWKENGVYYVPNSRTKQNMPIFYQMYEDFVARNDTFDVEKRLQSLNIPMQIVHGTSDPSVPSAAADQLKSWKPDAQLHFIDGADHVFGGSHPYPGSSLPSHAAVLSKLAIDFFKKALI